MTRNRIFVLVAAALLTASALAAQKPIEQTRGVDSRVDYASLVRFGPWDDRNYDLTQEDLALFAANEADLDAPVPAFYRVELRRTFDLLDTGEVQYPRSAYPRFITTYGGFLVGGRLYKETIRRAGVWVLLDESPEELSDGETADLIAGGGPPQRFLDGDARVTNPSGAAESAIAINPVDTNIVIAGTNGPGGGQRMHFSADGGETWTQAAALPLGGTCCDPTVAWSIDGTKGYAVTLGSGVWFYRTGDDGQTWTDLEVDTPGDPRRELGSGVDKEYVHVDQFPGSPHADNVYLTWHQGNVMQFARSLDKGNTWSTPLAFGPDDRGIGSDITTDTAGNIYYIYPAFSTRLIRLKKSTDGGMTFDPQTTVATTEGSFDFPVPSMEARNVFIYVAADTDRTGGPFNDSIYAAWTDNTGPDSGVPANNHARIQVAYSRNGGGTWTVRTPHETADSNDVDRYHQWLSVASDGSVHVIFYDTRLDATRDSVNIFHSDSTDGGDTWSTPERTSLETSPDIDNGFEFGDYNGLDIVMSDLIAIYTDTRAEGGGNTKDVYASGLDVNSDLLFADSFESGDISAWDDNATLAGDN
jgi:hypothetical protein